MKDVQSYPLNFFMTSFRCDFLLRTNLVLHCSIIFTYFIYELVVDYEVLHSLLWKSTSYMIYVGLNVLCGCMQDKWKTLVHTAKISPQQRRGEPVPQELLDRVLAAHSYWCQHQAKQHGKHQGGIMKITEAPTDKTWS